MSQDVITVQRVIPATPTQIFDLLADPAGQQQIDGSGTVTGARGGGGRRLALGDSFGMDMKMGAPYQTRNVVTEFETDRLIAWRMLLKGPMSKVLGGRTWRYELSPAEGGTLVRETWDNTTEVPFSRWATRRLGPANRRGMTQTLQRLHDRFADES